MKRLYSLLLLLAVSSAALAQTPTDLEFVPKGNICAGLTYGYSSWNEYWQGTEKISNGNVGTVSRQTIGVGANIGILDRLNLIVSVPYIITNASTGTLNGQYGIQDISINIKGKYGEVELGKGKLKFAGNLGFGTPISDYLVDFAPLSIGSGTTNISYRQLISYKLDKGFYFDVRANYTYRSNISDIHREYYYDDGNSYYTNEVNVPDQFDWAAAVGFSNSKLLAEVTYLNLITLGGTDIRTWDPGFPTNKQISGTINGRFDYYLSKPKGLNFHADVGYVISGRNVGQSVYGALTASYLFNVWGKKHTEDKPVN